MSIKGLLVTAEKWITVKIPAELAEGGIAIEKDFVKGETILAATFGKWFDEIKAQIESDEIKAKHGVVTQPVHAIEVSVSNPPAALDQPQYEPIAPTLEPAPLSPENPLPGDSPAAN